MMWSGLGGFLYFAFPDSFLGGERNCLGSRASDILKPFVLVDASETKDLVNFFLGSAWTRTILA